MTQEKLNDIILPEQAKSNPNYNNFKEKLQNSNKNDMLRTGGDINALRHLEVPIQNQVEINKMDNKKNHKYRRLSDIEETSKDASFNLEGNQIDSWKNHLDKNFKSTGTSTNMQSIKQKTKTIKLTIRLLKALNLDTFLAFIYKMKKVTSS